MWWLVLYQVDNQRYGCVAGFVSGGGTDVLTCFVSIRGTGVLLVLCLVKIQMLTGFVSSRGT